jgi:glutathione S-transferase
VRLVLAEKQRSFIRRPVDAREPLPPEIATLAAPMLPVLVDDSFAIWDSSVIAQYLDRVFPTPPLRPPDAKGKATVAMAMRMVDLELLGAIERITVDPNDATASDLLDAGLAAFDGRLGDRGYFLGTEFSLADIWLLSAVEKARAIGAGPGLHLQRLLAWTERVGSRPSAQAEQLAEAA